MTECEVDTCNGRSEILRFTTPVDEEKETRFPVDAEDELLVPARCRDRGGLQGWARSRGERSVSFESICNWIAICSPKRKRTKMTATAR